MNKAELIDALATKTTGVSKAQLHTVLTALTRTIQDTLIQGNTVQLIGFGTFATHQRAARSGRHPQTGAPLAIPATTAVKFTAGQAFREAVNQRKAKKGKGKSKGKS